MTLLVVVGHMDCTGHARIVGMNDPEDLNRPGISTDSFRILSRLDEFTGSRFGDPLDLLDHILFTLSGFSGMAMESMTRGLGWRFMDMGRRIERGINQADLIRLVLPHVCQDARSMLQALLEVSDSLMTYRGRYRSSFQLGSGTRPAALRRIKPEVAGFPAQSYRRSCGESAAPR